MKDPVTGVHPAAAVWPMLDEPDLRRLGEDIKENGLVYPIDLDEDGRILDGRNRHAACKIAGVEPTFNVYKGDPVARVLSANNERRHLSTGQRAMATALTLAADGKRLNGRWARDSVPTNGLKSNSDGWQAAMKRAGAILDHAPELAADVVTGTADLLTAWKQAEQNRKANERIASIGPDLAALIESGVIDIDEAERRLVEAERQAEDKKRIELLDDDLAQRVRDDHLDVGEAEAVMKERQERILVWADQIRDGIRCLARMVGYPIPNGLADALGEHGVVVVSKILGALEGEDCEFAE